MNGAPDTVLDEVLGTIKLAIAALIDARYCGDDEAATAIRYALTVGGKRVRPTLCLLTAHAVGVPSRLAMPAALAIEMVHTYSLVHDDLPCMDNDDWRRGKATTHVVHGVPMALLAGDALLTDAFGVLAADPSDLGLDLPPFDAPTQLALVRELATAAGGLGMVRGQALDLFWTKRGGYCPADLEEVHRLKTGQLLAASCAMGAIAARASKEVVNDCRQFGARLGLAFQILDDLLDDLPGTGKSPGKDRQAGKLTYLTVMSRSEAQAAAAQLTQSARETLARLNLPNGAALASFAEMLLRRGS